jgi:hypothetical protein
MKIFKIALVSDDTSSWTGLQMDAMYTIDLKKIISDPDAYDKPYEVSFTFKSISATATNSGVDMTKLYALCLEFGKGFTTYQNRSKKNYAGLLTINNDFTVYTSTACNVYFDTKESDNAPIYLNNIKNLDTIRVNVVNTSDNTTLLDANKAYLKYVCILTFKQVK